MPAATPSSLAERFPVFAELLRSRATPLRAAPVGPDGAWLVHWRNADTEAVYSHPGHHTLSFYLHGGHAVRCLQAPSARGEPGALCCMPAEHESRWDVRGSLELLHLYLPQLQFAQAAERWFDLEPRSAQLADRIYFHDERLARLCGRLAATDWAGTDAGLELQHLSLEVQAQLLAGHVQHRRPPAAAVRGGLSPVVRRRVLERIEAAITQGDTAALSLAVLAEVAHLSEFHFARMFKVSFGMSPHAWVMQRRLQRARELLVVGRLGLEEVAHRCGYAHLSHMNAALRRAGLGSASHQALMYRA